MLVDFRTLGVLVGLGGLEPPTSSLSGMRSSHLSYRPRRVHTWWSWSGSNRRPPECKSGALPAELQPLILALSFSCYQPLTLPAFPGEPEADTKQLIAVLKQSRPVGCRNQENQSLTTSEKPSFSKWRSGSCSPPAPKRLWRFGVERLSLTRTRCTLKRVLLSETPPTFSLRKEVIQPQVLLRLPCYDFTPIMNHTLGRCLLTVSAQTSSTIHFRDVTGGVYKARERIHGSVLICHY